MARDEMWMDQLSHTHALGGSSTLGGVLHFVNLVKNQIEFPLVPVTDPVPWALDWDL